MTVDLQPVVLSGGSGTRLWPLSREHYPKQLLPLHGDNTMLQDTLLRLKGFSPENGKVLDPVIVCNEEHRFLVAEQARQIGCLSCGILLEPAGRNTAPALTLAARHATAHKADPVLMVMPADHVIIHEERFLESVGEALRLAADGVMVTFGIVPTHPETGYGYIRKGAPLGLGDKKFAAARVDGFVEKPDLARATEYIASGDYLWNSGMFMVRASLWLKAIETLQPQIASACREAYENGAADCDFFRVAKAQFEECPSDSIDYAVMEKLTADTKGSGPSAVVVPLDAGWSDVGAWPAIWDIAPHDDDGNAIKGDVYAIGTRDTLAYAESRLVAVVGLDNMIVVETADAVLVAHKDRAQDIKLVVNRLKNELRSQHQAHRRVFRPWGVYEAIDAGDRFQVKRITVNPGAALSLQMHHHRAEHWIVVRGTARVTRGDDVFLVTENQSTYIPCGEKHRLENPGKVPLELIEVQSGAYLSEDDIVRFEDTYGRAVPR